jgi:hypothetical protein
LSYTNAGIIDNAEMNNLETVGNAQISTAQSKFGGASMLFDGSGDGLSFPAFDLGSGDMTVEFWAQQAAALPYLSGDGVYSGEIIAGNANNALGVFFYSGSSSGPATNIWVYVFGVATVFQPAISISLGQWNHYALVRSSGTWRLFVNGAQIATSTTSGTTNILGQKTIGWRNQSSFLNYYNGYIDDLRITRGYARYTANFTPQRSQWQDQ